MGEPTFGLEEITPKQAEAYLRKNLVNRPIRESKVKQYTRDMLSGRWNEGSGDTIRFNTDGELIDGQHRLTAVLKSGKTFKWLVVRGIDKKAQRTMDTGAPRSPADLLHMEQGISNAPLLVAIARNVFKIENNQMGAQIVVSSEEILSTVEEHPELIHSTEIAAQARGKTLTPIAPNVLGAAHWMIREVNGQGEADMFIWRVINLTGERDGSPVLALARRANEIKRNQMRMNHRWYLWMVIKTWNYDVEGKSIVKMMATSKSGVFELPEVLKREVSISEAMDAKEQEEEAAEKAQAS